MAAETAVDIVADKKKNNYVALKMKGKHKNGFTIDHKSVTQPVCLEGKEEVNGHENLSAKLNGFYNHVNSGKISAVRDGIRASLLRASPVRNKSLPVSSSRSLETGTKSEDR